MNVSVTDCYGEYRLEASNLSKENLLEIRTVLDKMQDLALVPEPPSTDYRRSIADVSYDLQQALILAAKMHYQYQGYNKIMTIKHIRTLSMGMGESYLGLKDAKELVDYAVDGFTPSPSWLKTSPY